MMDDFDEQTKFVYKKLLSKYKKQMIDKKELSVELSISVSCINYRVKQGIGLPSYNKGEGKTGRVTFALINVAKFLVHNNKKVM